MTNRISTQSSGDGHTLYRVVTNLEGVFFTEARSFGEAADKVRPLLSMDMEIISVGIVNGTFVP